MSVEKITLRLVGVGPMLMHNCRLADPLDSVSKAIAAITAKRLKTEADYDRVAELEWHGGLWLYRNRPCLPARCLRAVLVGGAKTRKKGAVARAAFMPLEPAMLEYDGSASLSELWLDERFRHREMVRVRESLTARTRPCFPNWSALVSATFISTMLNRREIFEFFAIAGPFGLGDGRPEFGRFVVEEP